MVFVSAPQAYELHILHAIWGDQQHFVRRHAPLTLQPMMEIGRDSLTAQHRLLGWFNVGGSYEVPGLKSGVGRTKQMVVVSAPHDNRLLILHAIWGDQQDLVVRRQAPLTSHVQAA